MLPEFVMCMLSEFVVRILSEFVMLDSGKVKEERVILKF